MALLTRTAPKNAPEQLATELIDARQAYNEVKTSVIDRATERQRAVQATIADLQAESGDLSTVIADARQP